MTGLEPAKTCATSKRLTVWLHTQCPLLDLNQWPPPCKGGALPTELKGRKRILTVHYLPSTSEETAPITRMREAKARYSSPCWT